MITRGQTLENQVTGERFTFTDTAASTNRELLGFDFALRAGGEARRHVQVRPALRMERLLLAPLVFAARHPRTGLSAAPTTSKA